MVLAAEFRKRLLELPAKQRAKAIDSLGVCFNCGTDEKPEEHVIWCPKCYPEMGGRRA
jgi:hypothetical protein